MELIAHYAPMVGLLFFFIIFLAITLWTWLPSNKQRLGEYATIPLKEEHDE